MPKIFDIWLVFEVIPQLLQYLPITLLITIVAMMLGTLLGLIIAVIKIKQIPVLSQLITAFVSFVRGTPLIIQLYLSYYGIPIVLLYINYFYATNWNVNNVASILFVLVAFSLNEAAYSSETIRSALKAVDKGQIEAAESLAMSYGQILRRIILPQAFSIALPNLANNLIQLLKGTSLAFVCSVVEMTAAGKILAGSNYRYFEIYIALAIIYWLVTLLIEKTTALLEKKLAIPATLPAADYLLGRP